MKVRVLDFAERDLTDAARFYESQHAGLGSYFVNSLIADIDSLALYGGIHVRCFGYFRALARRFPFAIYYELNGGTVEVHAVIDCRRDPRAIAQRLKQG